MPTKVWLILERFDSSLQNFLLFACMLRRPRGWSFDWSYDQHLNCCEISQDHWCMEMSSFWSNFHHWLHWKLSNDNFQCGQWWRFHQNDDVFVSVYATVCQKRVMLGLPCVVLYRTSKELCMHFLLHFVMQLLRSYHSVLPISFRITSLHSHCHTLKNGSMHSVC